MILKERIRSREHSMQVHFFFAVRTRLLLPDNTPPSYTKLMKSDIQLRTKTENTCIHYTRLLYIFKKKPKQQSANGEFMTCLSAHTSHITSSKLKNIVQTCL